MEPLDHTPTPSHPSQEELPSPSNELEEPAPTGVAVETVHVLTTPPHTALPLGVLPTSRGMARDVAGGVPGAAALIDAGLPVARNVRRMAMIQSPTTTQHQHRTPILLAEEILVRASLAAGTWARHDLVTQLMEATITRFPHMSPGQAITRFTTEALTKQPGQRRPRWVPTTAHTMVDTAASMYPEAKKETRFKSWRLGLATLYGRTAWYTRCPPITPLQFDTLMATGAIWFTIRLDVTYHCFARDADLTGVIREDIRMISPTECVIDFPFLKNDLTGEMGTQKHIFPLRPQHLQRLILNTPHGTTVFPQGYQQVLTELRRCLPQTDPASPKSGTRAIRRGAATTAEAGGANRDQIQIALAHKTITQQRT